MFIKFITEKNIIYRNSSDHELISKISNDLNTKTYSFQWGAFVNRNVKFGFKKMSHNYFFSWSNSYSKVLKIQ